MPELPDWLGSLTIAEIIAYLAGLSAAFLLARKVWHPIRRVFRTLEQIAEDWNGAPERKDASGYVVTPAVPGVLAQLETLRAQVQNDHSSNLREDIDEVHGSIKSVSVKLEEHIKIAKMSDESQGRVEDQMIKFTPMLEDLHAKYAPNPPPDPAANNPPT